MTEREGGVGAEVVVGLTYGSGLVLCVVWWVQLFDIFQDTLLFHRAFTFELTSQVQAPWANREAFTCIQCICMRESEELPRGVRVPL